MTVSVIEIRRLNGAGNLMGFATVVCGPFTILGLRIIQQSGQRPYVALPQEKARDGRYFPVIRTDDGDLKEQIQSAVLREWSRDYETAKTIR